MHHYPASAALGATPVSHGVGLTASPRGQGPAASSLFRSVASRQTPCAAQARLLVELERTAPPINPSRSPDPSSADQGPNNPGQFLICPACHRGQPTSAGSSQKCTRTMTINSVPYSSLDPASLMHALHLPARTPLRPTNNDCDPQHRFSATAIHRDSAAPIPPPLAVRTPTRVNDRITTIATPSLRKFHTSSQAPPLAPRQSNRISASASRRRNPSFV
jgi:hypothetical protein